MMIYSEGLDSFVRTEDLNNLERAWPAKRKEIAEVNNTNFHFPHTNKK